jgi:fumarate hydratase class II
VGGLQGQLELNVFKPVIAANVLHSARLLGDACASFAARCIDGLAPNHAAIQRHLDSSLMLVTGLAPHLGYAKAAEIAKRAHADGTTLRVAARALGYATDAELDAWLDPRAMIGDG